MSSTEATEEGAATQLVSIGSVLQYMGGPAAFDPAYSWTPASIAEFLLELEEPVFHYRGDFLIDTAIAEKLKAYLQDFLR